MNLTKEQVLWGIMRLGMGWIFFWTFLDKMFGLKFFTEPGKGFIDGGSPTYGILMYIPKGFTAPFFHALATMGWVDYVYLIGVLLIGISLLLGIGVRIAGISGTVFLILVYFVLYFPFTPAPEVYLANPFFPELVFSILIMIGFTFMPAGEWLGFGKWWGAQSIVRKFPILK